LSDKNAITIQPLTESFVIGGKKITFEAGKLGFLADGAVTISDEQ